MITIVFVLFVIIACLIYVNGKYNERYWKKRNVAFYTKHRVTGVFWDFLFKDKPVFENLCDVYKEYRNEPAVGIGSFLNRSIYVIDPLNVQHVLALDFKSFNHRGVEINEGDILADNILFMFGNRWKLMRQNMTPLFTSTKLKSMYYIIDKSAEDFVKHLQENKALLKGNTFDTISSFCSAAIGGAVFGVSTQSIFDSPFLEMSQKAFEPTFVSNLKFAIGILSPGIFKLLNIKLFKEHEDFFIGAIKNILRNREKAEGKMKMHDFADVCLSLQSAGKMVDKDTGLELEPTDELLAAQAFFFFTAGVEPTASAVFTTLFELGRNPDWLQKVQKEIDDTFKLKNNKLDFDSVMDMKYLDMVVSETMRMHPPIGFLNRQCVKDTVLPVGNIKIEKGTKMFTPIFALHHDERYFPDPYKFDPERFSPENRHSISDNVYMPFGRGNRVCVGLRYALLQSKAGLIYLLHNFNVRSVIKDGGIKYRRDVIQVRLDNVDVEFIPRN